jgi:hypothetical protein
MLRRVQRLLLQLLQPALRLQQPKQHKPADC